MFPPKETANIFAENIQEIFLVSFGALSVNLAQE